MEDKRIYSLNLLAFLLANNVKLEWHQDNNTCYATVEQDITEFIKDYKNNTFLHKYLNCFKDIKFKIREFQSMSESKS